MTIDDTRGRYGGPYDRLVQAVKDYLDDAYRADVYGDRTPWPTALEALVGWTAPEEV